MQILALSSSRAGESAYLEPAIPLIKNLLGEGSLHLAFIPFASVGSPEEYFQKVNDALRTLPYSIELVSEKNAVNSIENCDGILVGGGNTFKLLHDLYELELIDLIRRRVSEGLPYIGWSAGSNILGATINTTNDMPIIQPKSFEALNIFSFQINPHYQNDSTPGFNGETRDQRIEEFLMLNKKASVIALPEGCALVLKDDKIIYSGVLNGIHFSYSSNEIRKQTLVQGKEVLV